MPCQYWDVAVQGDHAKLLATSRPAGIRPHRDGGAVLRRDSAERRGGDGELRADRHDWNPGGGGCQVRTAATRAVRRESLGICAGEDQPEGAAATRGGGKRRSRSRRLAGAERYAPDTLQKAVTNLQNAGYMAGKQGSKPLETVAREAAQTAEDARIITIRKIQEQERAEERAARSKPRLTRPGPTRNARPRQRRLRRSSGRSREAQDAAEAARREQAQAEAAAAAAKEEKERALAESLRGPDWRVWEADQQRLQGRKTRKANCGSDCSSS